VVVRREAHGSFLKRHPYLSKGHIFPKLVLEFFLKTSGKKWKGIDIPKDDPLLAEDGSLYFPDKPVYQQEPFLKINPDELGLGQHRPSEIGDIALRTFLILEKAWQLVGRTLVDFKIELGISGDGQLLLADVIDNDSWRVVEDGHYIDKQVYRDGGDLNTVTEKYRQVAQLTSQFHLPRQRIILWRGSESDNADHLVKAKVEYAGVHSCLLAIVTCSVHKEPVRACQEIIRLVQEIPDTVLIAYVGKSNGAGPVLSTQVSVPVITVPATAKEFPDDVWSSLRMPSNVPVMTVLEPKNAVFAALQILAMRNPGLYADFRLEQEKRLCNTVKL
jgi:phosphoribosylaminoimidazole carboxylase/phosphoribosylaminoimidazole-succinocarboxamide synthase